MLPMAYQYIRSTYAIESFLSNVRQEYIFRLFWNVARSLSHGVLKINYSHCSSTSGYWMRTKERIWH